MKILYIGGFGMPDGNAAAQRVLAIAKSLKTHYSVSFLGLTHDKNDSGIVDGFEYKNLSYPSSWKEWLLHLTGIRELSYIKQVNPSVVIAYNFPAFGLSRIHKYCKNHSIKIIGDITEWYHPHNILKWLDTVLRMRVVNKKLSGLIVISHYLQNYYNNQRTFLMPPTIDSEDRKWQHVFAPKENRNTIELLYAGSPGRGDKDRLDNLVTEIRCFPNLVLNVVGINEIEYHNQYPTVSISNNVVFHGRQSHEKTIDMLSHCDFSIFFRKPSRVNNAGFPTKFVEAQTAGIPVVSSHFSDLDEYVEEGKNGFLADDISGGSIKRVLEKVSTLSREEILLMHSYTKSLNSFDYRLFSEKLVEFVTEC